MNAPLPLGLLRDAALAVAADGWFDTGAQVLEQLGPSLFDSPREGVLVTDAQARIVAVNDAFVARSGYAREQLLGCTPAVFASGRHDAAFHRALWEGLRRDGAWRGEVWNRRADGALAAQRLRIHAVRSAGAAPLHYVAIYGDPEDGPCAAQATGVASDPLTGLPGRAQALARLGELVAEAARQKRQVAVCFLDLERFQDFTGWWGDARGDALLMTVAERLRAAVRPGDTVARLSGDEFALLLGGLQGVGAVQATLERVQQALAQSCVPGLQVPGVKASIGVALYPAHGDAPETLLRAADAAMFRARRLGHRVCMAGAGAEPSLAQAALREALRDALAKEQLRLHWQPRVCARTGRVGGVEALLHWQHPGRGLLPAAAFLPAAAGTPLDVELDLWVMRTAAAQQARWRQAGCRLPLSLPVSAAMLALPDLADTVACLLLDDRGSSNEGVPEVELRVRESAALDDPCTAARAIQACARHGIGVALDGFGTGDSTLGTLRRLPVRALRIDAALVGRMLVDPGDLHVVRAAIGMAAAFGARSVAVGVDSAAQARQLAELGCDELQGLAVAAALPAPALEAWLDARSDAPH